MKRTMSTSEWVHWCDDQKPLTGDVVVVGGRRMTITEVNRDRVVMED